MKKIIIITGYLASGKSNFYNEVKLKTKIVGFSKDELKITICCDSKSQEIFDNYKLSNMAFEKMMDELENLMESGKDIIIEGAFSNKNVKNKENEQEKIMQIIKKYGYTSLVFHLTGDMRILYERFAYRERSSERNQALQFNMVSNNYRIYKLINRELQKCLLGDYIIEIDTTDFSKVEYTNFLNMVEKFIEN